jgi:hypothetical protein
MFFNGLALGEYSRRLGVSWLPSHNRPFGPRRLPSREPKRIILDATHCPGVKTFFARVFGIVRGLYSHEYSDLGLNVSVE